jgi:hypothetical protein
LRTELGVNVLGLNKMVGTVCVSVLYVAVEKVSDTESFTVTVDAVGELVITEVVYSWSVLAMSVEHSIKEEWHTL